MNDKGIFPLMGITNPSKTAYWVDKFKEQQPRFAIVRIELDFYSQLFLRQGVPAAEAAVKIFCGEIDRAFSGSKVQLRVSVEALEIVMTVNKRESKDALIRWIRTNILKRSDGNLRMGIVVCPDDGKDTKQLLNRLDNLMPSIRGSDDSVDFGEEIAANRIVPYVQGVYGPNRELKKVEMLSRWESKTLGTFGPSEFMDSVRLQGYRAELFFCTLNNAIDVYKSLNEKVNCPVVSMNIETGLLSDDSIIKFLIDNSEKYMNYIEFEIGDNGGESEIQSISDNIEKLAAIGYSFAICYSSTYGWLNSLNAVSTIKLDSSLCKRIVLCKTSDMVKDVGVDVLEALINVGRDKKIDLVAESIESQQQFDVLKGEGVTGFQGYHFDRPAGVQTFLENLDFIKKLNATETYSFYDIDKTQ